MAKDQGHKRARRLAHALDTRRHERLQARPRKDLVCRSADNQGNMEDIRGFEPAAEAVRCHSRADGRRPNMQLPRLAGGLRADPLQDIGHPCLVSVLMHARACKSSGGDRVVLNNNTWDTYWSTKRTRP